MMMNPDPYENAHELAKSIITNDIYLRYTKAKYDIDDKPQIKEKILSFRKKQMEVNQAQILGKELPDDKIREVALEYAQLNRDKIIAEFLEAEGTFIQMFGDIQQIIQNAIEQGLSKQSLEKM